MATRTSSCETSDRPEHRLADERIDREHFRVPADDRRHELGDQGRRRLRRRRQSGHRPAEQDHRPEHRLADERVDRDLSAFLPTIADTNWEIRGVGDFNGDRKADVILRNKSTGQNIGWLMNGLTVSNAAFLPTIADTNWEIKAVVDSSGDSKADVVWRNKTHGPGHHLADGRVDGVQRHVPADDRGYQLGVRGFGKPVISASLGRR